MKNLFTILFVTLLASCGTTQTEEAVVETDSTTVELPVEVEVEVVDTTAVDTTVAE
jgi:hypothetical protein